MVIPIPMSTETPTIPTAFLESSKQDCGADLEIIDFPVSASMSPRVGALRSAKIFLQCTGSSIFFFREGEELFWLTHLSRRERFGSSTQYALPLF